MLGAHCGGPVGFGQPVDVGHVEPQPLHALDHRGRRRGGGHHGRHSADAPAQLLGGVDQHVVHDWGPAIMRDPFGAHQPEDLRRVHLAQAHVRPRVRRDRPREAPPVAVEHRQCPQVDAVPGHAPGQDVPYRVQVRAPVVVDDAFGLARRPRGVVQRDRLPLIRRLGPLKPRRRTRKQRLVVLVPQPVPRPVVLGIVDVDHQGARLAQPQCLGYRGGEFPVGDQYPGLGVIKDVSDRRGVQPGVDRVQHRAGHRDPEVRLHHLRGIRRDHRHRIPAAHAPRRQRRGKPLAPLPRLRPGEPPPAVHDGQPVGIDVRAPVQEHQRRQRRVVRRIRLQPRQVDVTHSPSVI